MKILTLPNIVTFSRLPLAALSVTLYQQTFEYATVWAFGCFLLGVYTDYLDGWLARARNQVSDFGKMMDPLVDKLYVFVFLIWLLGAGIIQTEMHWWVSLLLLREWAILSLRYLRVSQGKPVFGAEAWGKLKSILLYTALTLWLAIITLVTVYEGLAYTRVSYLEFFNVVAETIFMLGVITAYYSLFQYLARYAK